MCVLLPEAAKAAGHAERVGEFLKRTPLSAQERLDVFEAVKTAPSRTEWLMSGDGEIYSAVLRQVQKDSRSNVQIRLEEAARTQANVRAHYLLYLRAVPAARKARYADEDSIASALSGWDSGRGDEESMKPELSASLAADGWAFAILRIRGELIDRLSTRLRDLPDSALDTAYCAALYPRAKALFGAGEYEKALPVYRELHSLKWAKPAAYLDAAECFLHTGDKESAGRLVEETAAELEDAMDSFMLERAGDILLESGNDKEAERLYRLASGKLQQES